MKTRFCQRPGCGDVADGKSQWCTRHKATLAGRDPDGALRSAIASVTGQEPPPLPVTYTCKQAGCDEPARSPVGLYCYCTKHREERIQQAAAASSPAPSPAPAPAPAPALAQLRDAGMFGSQAAGTTTAAPRVTASAAPDTRTHEERMRAVMNSARALDRAETRMKLAQKELRAARRVHEASIADAFGRSGVTLTDE